MNPNTEIRLRVGAKGSFASWKHADRNITNKEPTKLGQELGNVNTWNTGEGAGEQGWVAWEWGWVAGERVPQSSPRYSRWGGPDAQMWLPGTWIMAKPLLGSFFWLIGSYCHSLRRDVNLNTEIRLRVGAKESFTSWKYADRNKPKKNRQTGAGTRELKHGTQVNRITN